MSNRKISIPIILFFTLGIITGYAINKNYSEETFSGSFPAVILIDAGHGTPDGGAVGANGTIEKDINLAIALKTGETLESRGFKVLFTRTEDNGIYDDENSSIREKKLSDMKKRRKMMEDSNADLFLSIHMNSFGNSQANGLHIFYSAEHEYIKPLAEEIQQNISSITNAQTHTVKTVSEDLFLMKKPPLPCILAECGFLSNPEEERKLNDEEYQSKIAWAIADAVYGFFK